MEDVERVGVGDRPQRIVPAVELALVDASVAGGADGGELVSSQSWMPLSSMVLGAVSVRITGVVAVAGPTPYSPAMAVQYVVPPTLVTKSSSAAW